MTVQQTQLTTGKLTTIEIGRMSKEAGERIKSKLHGKTYMSFKILVCPACGEWEVLCQSSYDGSADEILGMFIYTMATELAGF